MRKIETAELKKFKEFDNHKVVFRIEEPEVGLKAFVAIHNDNRGPAIGGTRFFPFTDEKEAIADALGLSRGMTYKCALAGLNYGGGKAVIIGTPKIHKTKELLLAYASKLEELNGQFFTGEDVGMKIEDVLILAEKTKSVIGASAQSDNPSYWTALGVFYALQAALEEKFQTSSAAGKIIAIKGLGKVGKNLAKLILEDGGNIVASDTDEDTLENIKKEFPEIKIVAPQDIHKQEADAYSPCAMSLDLTEQVIRELASPIVCGAANRQLGSPESGRQLFQSDILYVPDYLANAGGVINVVDELHPDGYSVRRVRSNVEKIKETARKIIGLSKETKKPTDIIADKLAEEHFDI